MEQIELQKLLKLESEILGDLYFRNDLIHIGYDKYYKFIDIAEGEKAVQALFQKMNKHIESKIKGTNLAYSLTIKFTQEKKRSMGGELREYFDATIDGMFFHKIPSKSMPDVEFKQLNSTFSIDMLIAHRGVAESNSKWEFLICQSNHSEHLNQAFLTETKRSECNTVTFFKYDELEYVAFNDEFSCWDRFHQCEGDILYLDLSTFPKMGEVTLTEDLDFITTDGAVRFFLQKK
jgi:hypothetical protein